ncbi:RNase P subunit p30-domain-containing protein [Mycotypha africana]|uniref:RNase P subunit p30-domain-containing protein n=1 Tax=Mycotypha africana TaxID=64632 RepID=UPI002300448D|nr:RNase P subunit p30-domain-containing protein [Mycotypha africana]KAI8970326.1 RNase P subunit p30-domain-containing protein [Mycotypha africana]
MFYDFNIPFHNNNDAVEERRIEKILQRIDTIDPNSMIAFNLLLEDNLTAVKPIKPIALDKLKKMKQLTRATLIVEDPKRNYQLASSTAYPQIDILAVRPTNIDICKHACQTLEVDLISLDLAKTRVLPSFVSAQVAVNRGLFFEICYSQSFRDPHKKFMFYSNVRRLVEVTRGHNLIFSSEATRALEIRRPADLRILGSMFGMTHDQIEATVTANYPRLLKKAETRKLTYNATISLGQLPQDPLQENKKSEFMLKRKERDADNKQQYKKAGKKAKKQKQKP